MLIFCFTPGLWRDSLRHATRMKPNELSRGSWHLQPNPHLLLWKECRKWKWSLRINKQRSITDDLESATEMNARFVAPSMKPLERERTPQHCWKPCQFSVVCNHYTVYPRKTVISTCVLQRSWQRHFSVAMEKNQPLASPEQLLPRSKDSSSFKLNSFFYSAFQTLGYHVPDKFHNKCTVTDDP